MLIRIVRSFASEFSPRPLITNELIDVADDIAERWISERKAQAWTLTANPTPPPAAFVPTTPPKTKREKATRNQ